MQIINMTKGTTLATNATRATGLARFKGLLFTDHLPAGSGLFLEKTRQVHMFLMRYAIDVVFIDRANQVVATVHELQPWKVSPLVRDACCAIELPAGTLRATNTTTGDQLEVSAQNL